MSFIIQPVSQTNKPPRLSMILWGEAGNGKTSLACTAPGKKLLILFDPDGDTSVRTYPNTFVMDVSELDQSVINECKKADPFGVAKIIEEQQINTVIIDSITRVSTLALKYVVPFNKGATDTNPTQGGYGMRNLIIVNFIDTMIKLTKRLNCNIIFITHEGTPDKNESGNILSVGMMLGGQLPGLVSKDISEVWLLSDSNNKRRISIRPERFRSPMKSRMFDQETDTGFEWKFSPRTPDKGHTIASFWKQWCDSGYTKLMVPK